MNKAFITGNVTRDAELRTTQTGVNVCTFTVAVNPKNRRERESDNDGTEFFRVTAWRKLAEVCGKYVKKGMKICVIGAVGHDEYTDNKGEKRFNLTLMADDIEFLSRVENSNTEDYSQAPEVPQSQQTSGGFTDVSMDFDSDSLPF